VTHHYRSFPTLSDNLHEVFIRLYKLKLRYTEYEVYVPMYNYSALLPVHLATMNSSSEDTGTILISAHASLSDE
jgi:hypothetical protein